MRIAIVGCGTAGPSAAIALARDGHRVEVFDRAKSLDPVGAGLLIQPTGIACLRELGVLDRLVPLSARIERLAAMTKQGRVLLDLRYAGLRDDLHGLGVGRGALLGVLLDAMHSAGVHVMTGTEIGGVRPASDGRQAIVVDASGAEVGAFDLVVVADGARSILARSHGRPSIARSYTWGALWSIVDLPADDPVACAGVLDQVADSTSRLMGLLPSGCRDTNRRGPRTVSVFWSVRTDQIDAVRSRSIDAWKAEARALHPRSATVLDRITSTEQLLPAVYHEVVMRQWHMAPSRTSAPMVFLGDAAHALSPLLGMGANLGLVDGLVLARTLREGISRGADLATALSDYSRERRGNIRFYQWACRWMTPAFQSDSRAMGLARDLVMGPSGRVPWVRGQMLRAVAGVKTGLLAARELPERSEVRARLAPDGG